MSEEQQNTEPVEITIDVALLMYKNFQQSIATAVDKMASPYNYDNRGKATKRKKEANRLTDLVSLALVVKAVAHDIEPNPEQFETEKVRDLYAQLMAISKAKEVIKADLRNKLMNNDSSVVGVSDELKQKVMKGL